VKNLALILILLSILFILISCDGLFNPAEESNAWGCTRYITITWSDGRDTTYRELFVASGDVSGDETKVETLAGGITKTTIKHVTCTHLPGSP